MSKRSNMERFLDDKNSRERIVSFWHHFSEDCWFSEKAVEAHLNFYRETGIDFLKIMEEVRYEFNFSDVSGWRGFKLPNEKSKERNAQLDLIKKISDAIGDECMIFTTIFDPLRSVGIVKGYDFIETHIKEDEKAVSDAFLDMAESIIRYAVDCLAAGADGIFFSSKGAEKGRFSEETFMNIVHTPDKYITDLLYQTGKRNILHICGYNTELKYYSDFNTDIVNWDCHNGHTLSEGAELFKDKIILGGMKNRGGVLTNGTVEEIEEEVKSVVTGFTSSNRLILGADCTLDEDVDYSRVKAAVCAYHQL